MALVDPPLQHSSLQGPGRRSRPARGAVTGRSSRPFHGTPAPRVFSTASPTTAALTYHFLLPLAVALQSTGDREDARNKPAVFGTHLSCWHASSSRRDTIHVETVSLSGRRLLFPNLLRIFSSPASFGVRPARRRPKRTDHVTRGWVFSFISGGVNTGRRAVILVIPLDSHGCYTTAIAVQNRPVGCSAPAPQQVEENKA